jgi:ATP-dependent RNA helicase DDX5/DBP2
MEDYVHRIGTTRRVGTSSHVASFYIDKYLFLIAQIKRAITDVELGNTMAFATRKVTKRKEREQVIAFWEGRLAHVGVTQIGVTMV